MRVAGLVLIVLLSGCATLQGVIGDPAPEWADQYTIERDEWGVPHISGRTDAAVVFGLAYAQAEDNFWQIEEDLLRAIGRAANLYGEAELANDLVKAAFDVQRLARAEYAREPPERRVLWDAWAAGLNHYLATHPEVRPRLLWHVEPWFVFARMRAVSAGTMVDGVQLGDPAAWTDALPGGARLIGTFAADSADAAPAGARAPMPAGAGRVPSPAGVEGSSLWAIAPARTANGHALLLQSPHTPLFGAGQYYEVHLRSDEGWHVAGTALLGTPIPRAGHNEHLAWGHTNSASDTRDSWIVSFDHPS
ncbi:MAG: penicillin acylase family protein, partial [Longimicrobiales bacterium]